ncbi:MAG: tetratricopeptide repeat protein [Candidatus Krumholzibacteriia bacterium]
MNLEDRHIDWNDLAALAEDGHRQAAEQTLAHLAVCGTCLAAYADAVQARDGELAGRAAAPVPTPLPLVPRRRRRPQVAWATGTLAAAAVLLVLLLPRGQGPFTPGDPRLALQTTLETMSADGPLLPGVRHLEDGGGTRYRAGDEAAAGGLDALLEPFARRFGADPADSDAAYWLGAAYLATGRLHYADDVLRRALQRHPGAAGLRHLDAVTAYRLNELDRAEAVLRRILADRPGDGTARFNLALIEYETRRVDEARAELQTLATADANPAVRARAQELLQAIDD